MFCQGLEAFKIESKYTTFTKMEDYIDERVNTKSFNKQQPQFGSMLRDHKGQPCEGSFVFFDSKNPPIVKMEKPASSTNNSSRGGKKSSKTHSARTTSFYASSNSKSSLNLRYNNNKLFTTHRINTETDFIKKYNKRTCGVIFHHSFCSAKAADFRYWTE